MNETQTNKPTVDPFWGEVISTYSRKQAIEDGVLVDLMQDKMAEVARQHYKYPIACTAAVWEIIDKAVKNPKWCNDYAGVLHDMLWMSRVYKRQVSEDTIIFRVKIVGAGRQQLFDFKMVCGPDDDGSPCMTILCQDED